MNDAMIKIANRTKGEFYLGVVGSVRSGKSSFIRRFIEVKALPLVDDEFLKNKIIDEMPQTSAGKQIMTVEPKFVPQNALPLMINEETTINIRLVDSVGYIIPTSSGYYNDDGPRLVKTPWYEEPVPFKDAAEIGTKKVIQNHSNIGVFVTSDGSFGDFTRDDYKINEGIIINELNALDKPFVIVLNSTMPKGEVANQIKKELEEKYDVSVIPINVLEMTDRDIDNILSRALDEFSIEQLDIKLPSWISCLSEENEIKENINKTILDTTETFKKFKHIENIKKNLLLNEYFIDVKISEIEPDTGKATLKVLCDDTLYEEIVDNALGCKVTNRGEFISILEEYRKSYNEYKNIKSAVESVNKTGYGIVVPQTNEMKLEKPIVSKQGGRYGIKLKAVCSTIHMIKVDIDSTFEPIIGTLEQSNMIIDNINNDEDIWNQELFGKSLGEVINDGVKAKIHLIPENAKMKFKDTLEKVVNNGNGGLIAIIL